ESFCVAAGISVSQNVDWIAAAPVRRKNPAKRGVRSWRKRRDLTTRADKGIRRQHGRPTGIRDHGESRAAWTRLFSQHLRHVKEVRDAADAQHAAAAKGSVEYLIAAGERTGV